MASILLLSGGAVHDHKSCGVVLREVLSGCPDFSTDHVDDDLDVLLSPRMASFDAMVMYWTGGEIPDSHLTSWSNWLKGGKGLVSVHGGAASFKHSDEYRAMLGGHLVSHPHYRDYQVSITEAVHPITDGLDEFMVRDEQYLCSYDSRVSVLANALHKGVAHPVIWVKEWGRGRICFNALGHDAAACSNPTFGRLIARGTRWAVGMPPEAA